ncbi:MAG: response regulator [Candidatus Aminicenantes bacterium]|nr:response regulator [Candidatus Aminicenantes bacterium]
MNEKQIMVVEDERIVGEDIKMRLQKLGYAVPGIAHSGEEAIKKAGELRPDLVMMDIVIEGKMDGIEAATAIRSRFDIPVVYLTAFADKNTLDRAKVTEAFGYIIKPFEDRELNSIIEIALYKHSMERKLKEREQWLFTTLKSIGDAVIATDSKGCVTFMNPVAQALTGWKQEEVEGKPIVDIFKILNEETGKPDDNPVLRALQKGAVTSLTNHTILIARDGKKVPINNSCAPIKLKNGDISGAVVVFQDITGRKKTMDKLKKAYADLKKAQQELIQSEKLAALGRFSSGLAHEIKNPLGIILGGTEFLEIKLPQADNDIKTAINKIKESTFRANNVVHGLLKFSRPSELKTGRTKPDDLIKDTLSLLKYRMPLSNIKIETYYAKEKLFIEADKNQMQQVFFNILINAIDAMPKGGTIAVKTYKTEQPEPSSNKHLCVIEFSDTGEGISKNNLDRLFEPFFTTKRDKKGTGLGLSMSKMIVNNHNGDLEIESEIRKGTTVKVVLPLAKKETQGNEK